MKRNAIIMAAGYSSRFTPVSKRHPKGLTCVKGEILVERQIRQLKAAGIEEIILVTGYKKELFAYLEKKFQVLLVDNPEYTSRNNHSSIYAARKYLGNTYICSSDNYFPENPFLPHWDCSYYAALYAHGSTDEWCLALDADNQITDIRIGGSDSWYMLGHSYWTEDFSRKFLTILEAEYEKDAIRQALWEDIYRNHLDTLSLHVRKYPPGSILEFDTVADLTAFDPDFDSGKYS